MAVPSPVLGYSPGGAGESYCRRLPPPSPSIPAQPSSSKMGESSEEHESVDDIDCYQLFKDYCNVQAVLSVTRLNVEMLRNELDASHNALQASGTEFSKIRVN
jgi:hypothetical protein